MNTNYHRRCIRLIKNKYKKEILWHKPLIIKHILNNTKQTDDYVINVINSDDENNHVIEIANREQQRNTPCIWCILIYVNI